MLDRLEWLDDRVEVNNQSVWLTRICIFLNYLLFFLSIRDVRFYQYLYPHCHTSLLLVVLAK